MENYITNYMLWFVVALLFIGLIRTLFFKNPPKPIQEVNENNSLPDVIDLGLMIEPLRRKSQPETIIAWLEKVGLFPIEYASHYGMKNVSAVITTLKQRGYKIKAVKTLKKITHYELIK